MKGKRDSFVSSVSLVFKNPSRPRYSDESAPRCGPLAKIYLAVERW